MNQYLGIGRARLRGLSGEVLAVAAGATLPLAFAPMGYWGFALLSPIAALYSFLQAGPGRSFLRGWLFAFSAYAYGISWVRISIHEYGGLPMPLALSAALLLAAFLALFPALACLGTRLMAGRGSPGLAALIAFPAAWTLAEWYRTWLFTGFPWLGLGYSQIDSPLRGYAPILGVLGVNWVLLSCSALLALLPGRLKACGLAFSGPEPYQRNSGQINAGNRTREVGRVTMALTISLTISLALPALLFGGGALLAERNWSTPEGETLQVTLVQGAEQQSLSRNHAQKQALLQRYLRLSREDWGKDLLVWPESALPFPPHAEPAYLEAINAHVQRQGGLFVTGLFSLGQEEQQPVYYNSLLASDGNGPPALYHKRHLVPFGEYIPLKSLLTPWLQRLGAPVSGLAPGPEALRPLLLVGKLRLGVSICYEDLFGMKIREALPEAQLLINLSNDGWFGDSTAPWQHLEIARMRALENSRFLLRATNSGSSAIIAADGQVLQRTKLHTPAVLRAEVPLLQGTTPYSRYGDSLVLVICLISLGLIPLGGLVTRWRRQPPLLPPPPLPGSR